MKMHPSPIRKEARQSRRESSHTSVFPCYQSKQENHVDERSTDTTRARWRSNEFGRCYEAQVETREGEKMYEARLLECERDRIVALFLVNMKQE